MNEKLYKLAGIENEIDLEVDLESLKAMVERIKNCAIPENYPEWHGLPGNKRLREDKIDLEEQDFVSLAHRSFAGFVLAPSVPCGNKNDVDGGM